MRSVHWSRGEKRTAARVAHFFSGGNPITVVTTVSNEVEALSGREYLWRGRFTVGFLDIAVAYLFPKGFPDEHG